MRKREMRSTPSPSLLQANRVIGSTAYLAVAPKHKAAEIGRTWYSPDLWGTVVNPECKLLLLEHAFEDWGPSVCSLGLMATTFTPSELS